MKRYLSTVLVLILASQAFGQPTPKVAPDAIRFPVVTQPTPIPTPVVMPTLDASMMYVIEADIPTLLITAPPGLVTVTQSGPVTIRAKFIDGNGSYETKSFTGKTVYQIVAAGKGKCHFFVVPLGLDTKVTDVRTRAVMVDSGQAPQPPPIPVPPVDAFTKSIQDAYAKDGSPADSAAKLASIYKLSKTIVDGSAKSSDVVQKMGAAITTVLGDTSPPKVLVNVRQAINVELKSTLGTTDMVLDATKRAAIQAEFTKVQKALETLK